MEQAQVLMDLRVVFRDEERSIQTDATRFGSSSAGLNAAVIKVSVELLQCQLLSLYEIDIDDQTLVDLHTGRVLFKAKHPPQAEFLQFEVASTPPRVLLLAENDRLENQVDSDAFEICTRATFGQIPIVQKPFCLVSSQEQDQQLILCQACAQTCTTATQFMDPIGWNASEGVSRRFISEIAIVAGDADTTAPNGFTRLPFNLNAAVCGPHAYMCIKRGGLHALSALDVVFGESLEAVVQSNASKNMTLLKQSVPDDSRDSKVFFCFDRVNQKLGKNHGRFAITDICFVLVEEETIRVPKGFIRLSKNLNKGAGPDVPELFLCFKMAPIGSFVCGNHSNSAAPTIGECLFATRHLSIQTWSILGAKHVGALEFFGNARRQADHAFWTGKYRLSMPKLRSQLEGGLQRVQVYEIAQVQDAAREKIPIALLNERARANPNALPDPRDELLKQLLNWFKKEFFQWTNKARCQVCGSDDTQSVRTEGPSSPEEIAGDAGRVEVYHCAKCSTYPRFPRYNNPVKLLETRHGRCGEWANCFTLCCRALGFDARYVLDVTDHVWTEVYSEHHKRWLHCDPCENQMDCPLTYEVGWGKDLSYVFAFGRDHVVDVARRYTVDFDALLTRRHDADEQELAKMIQQLNETLWRQTSGDRVEWLKQRLREETMELVAPKQIKQGEVSGRVSGSQEWKDSRREAGNKSAPSSDDPSHRSSSLSSAPIPDRMQVLQEICRTLLTGCDDTDCVNPACAHSRQRHDPDLDPTVRAAQALQLVSRLQNGSQFSVEGLRALLCPSKDDLRWFLLSHDPILYCPLQDGCSRQVVDISWSGHHGANSRNIPGRRHLTLQDGQAHFGMELAAKSNSGQLVLPLKMPQSSTNDLLVTFFARFEHFGDPMEDTEIFCMRLLGFGDEDMELRVGVNTQGQLLARVASGQASSSNEKLPIEFERVNHFGFVKQNGQAQVVVNGKQVLEMPYPKAESLQDQPQHQLVFGSSTSSNDSIRNGFGNVTCIMSDVAVFDKAQAFQGILQRVASDFLPTIPLQAFTCDGRATEYESASSNHKHQLYPKQAETQSGFRVSKVKMWGDRFFDGIQFVYNRLDEPSSSTSQQVEVEGPLVGNSQARDQASTPTVTLDLLPDEFIVAVSGRKGAWTDCLRIETNLGRVCLCGGNGGDEFTISFGDPKSEIRAIQFDVGDHLVNAVAFTSDFTLNHADAFQTTLTTVLDGVPGSKQQETLEAMLRYLENLATEPTNPKFHRIRSGNRFFQQKLFGNLGETKCQQLLQLCHFALTPAKDENDAVYCVVSPSPSALQWKQLVFHVKVRLALIVKGSK